MILFVALGALFAIMGGIVYYASLDNPELEKAEIHLSGVRVLDVNNIEKTAKLETSFLLKNPSDKTFTVAVIAYELFANEKSLGNGQYSVEDIAMPGRAAFYPGSEIELKSIFHMNLNESNSKEYNSIISGQDMEYSVTGIVTVETAWSLIEKEFESSL